MSDTFFENTRDMVIKANEAFYVWEQGRYNGHSPLSDDDRIVWMQGYVYAHTQRETQEGKSC